MKTLTSKTQLFGIRVPLAAPAVGGADDVVVAGVDLDEGLVGRLGFGGVGQGPERVEQDSEFAAPVRAHAREERGHVGRQGGAQDDREHLGHREFLATSIYPRSSGINRRCRILVAAVAAAAGIVRARGVSLAVMRFARGEAVATADHARVGGAGAFGVSGAISFLHFAAEPRTETKHREGTEREGGEKDDFHGRFHAISNLNPIACLTRRMPTELF